MNMMDNASSITVFTMSGLSGIGNNRIPLFVATLLCYCLICVANVTIIVTIIMDRNLHEPMYVFICNLCINALFVTAGFYPKFLIDLLSSAHVISKVGCLFQGYVIHGFLGADYSILLLMLIAISSITTSNERLCGSHIPKIYCINYLVNRIACALSIAAVAVPAFNYTFYVAMFLLLFENRVKFMTTCLPHIICLIIFFGSILFDLLYSRFGSDLVSDSVKNFIAIEFLVVPPLSNPFIYGLKLTKIRNRLLQMFRLKPL
uniref:G-protein coupled receptors family 1 profile domain-containing protein n=1 Tax=Neogobius melanostomus TaxID=47308 RepID=A0A8C6WRG2_9GOBI